MVDPHRRSERHALVAYRRIHREAMGSIVHAHVAGIWNYGCLGAMAGLGARVVLTVHGQSLEDDYCRTNGWQRRLIRSALRRFRALIAVNEVIRDFAVSEIGLAPGSVFHIPAFLPPSRECFDQPVDAEVQNFLDRYPVVLSANAFDLTSYKGVPLYGIDMLVDLLVSGASDHPGLAVVVFVSTMAGGGEERLRELDELARSRGVRERLLVVTGSRPFEPVLVRSTALLRPTVTDGDSVSIRDALWHGIPVVASDAVPRPPGVRTFRNRDPRDLWRVTSGVLESLDRIRAEVAALPRRDSFDDVVEVYRSMV
jgi:glycosyltransferase involved in cell wall biosynthesis